MHLSFDQFDRCAKSERFFWKRNPPLFFLSFCRRLKTEMVSSFPFFFPSTSTWQHLWTLHGQPSQTKHMQTSFKQSFHCSTIPCAPHTTTPTTAECSLLPPLSRRFIFPSFNDRHLVIHDRHLDHSRSPLGPPRKRLFQWYSLCGRHSHDAVPPAGWERWPEDDACDDLLKSVDFR